MNYATTAKAGNQCKSLLSAITQTLYFVKPNAVTHTSREKIRTLQVKLHNMKIIWKAFLLLLIVACTNNKIKTASSEKSNTTEKTEKTPDLSGIPEFDIDFPESDYKITTTQNTVEQAGGAIVTNWILQGKDENGPFLYYVAHNELSGALKTQTENNPSALNTAFEAAIRGSADKLGAADYTFKEIKLGNYPGMESVCKVFNGEGMLKSRVYKIDDSFMMVSAGGRQIDTTSVNIFLNSFQLKK